MVVGGSEQFGLKIACLILYIRQPSNQSLLVGVLFPPAPSTDANQLGF